MKEWLRKAVLKEGGIPSHGPYPTRSESQKALNQAVESCEIHKARAAIWAMKITKSREIN